MTWPRLLHMGGVVVDFVYRIAKLPEAGGESVARSFETTVGGGYNVMAAAVASGMGVAYGGGYGQGPYGALIREAMSERGIGMLQPPSVNSDSGTCVVMVTADAERTFVSWPGAEGILEPEDLARVKPQEDDWVFISGYTLSYAGSGPALADWVASLPPEVPVVFDPSPLVGEIPAQRRAAVLGRADWLSCNRAETAAIAGEGTTAAQADRLIEELCPRARGIVIRAGSEDSFLRLRDEALMAIPAFQVEARDTNGAGDTHLGAFMAEISRGEGPAEALRYANAAAAISVTRDGGASAPARDEIESFLREQAPETARRVG